MDASEEKIFLSTKEAAQRSGYNASYLGQLAKEGKVVNAVRTEKG